MRADNDGEGGILALMSLLGIKHGERAGVIALGILGAALLRRRHHPGDFGAERARGDQDTPAGIRALCVAAVDLRSHRSVLPATPGHCAHRPAVRPDHDALVRDNRGARAARYHPPSQRAGGARPALRAPISVRAWIHRVFGIGRRVPVRHRCRGALCRYGPLRPATDKARLVRAGAADTAC